MANGVPGGGWPPPKDPTKKSRADVTSAAAEMAGAIGDQHTADGFTPQTPAQSPIESASRPSALTEHAELTVSGTSEKMTPDELNVYRAGEAARKEREAAKREPTTSPEVGAAPAQMPTEQTDAPNEQVPVQAPVPEAHRAQSPLEALAEAVRENSESKMTPEEVAIFRAGEEKRRAALAEATPKEKKEALRSVAVEAAMKRNAEATEESQKAEAEYFAALAKHQKARGLLSVSAETVVGELGTPEKLKALRRTWVRSRANIAAAHSESVTKRLEERSDTREAVLARLKDKTTGLTGEAALRARYERMHTLKQVVLGVEERELAVRTEALSKRDKGTVEKMLDWYNKKTPAPVRIIVSSALMFGAAAGVGALATGSFGIAPAALFLAGGGAATRAIASMQKSEMGRKILNWAAVVPSVAGLVGLATEGAVRGTHALLGTEAKAEALLKQDTNLGNLASMRNLEKLSAERKKALVAKETIARQSKLARTLSSVGFGFLFGHHAGQQGVAHDHAESAANAALAPGATAAGSPELPVTVGHDAVPTDQAPAVDTTHAASVDAAAAPTAGGEHVNPQGAQDSAPAATGANHLASEASPAAPAAAPEVHTLPATPEGITMGATIHTSGEGFGQMIMEFKQNFHEQLGAVHPSPAEAHVLNSDPNALAREIGAITGNSSLQMHQGDQVFADEHGDVWFQPSGQDAQLIFHNDPTAPGGFTHHAIEHGVFRPDHVAPEAAPPKSPDEITTELNRAQVSGHEAVQPVEPVTVEHVEAVKPIDGSDIKPTALPSQLDTAPAAPVPAAPHSPEASSSAPETHAAPEHAPVVTPETAPFTNPLGVEVNPAAPAVYSIPQPGGGEVLYMFGGPGSASYLAAQQYVMTHPGTEVRFTAESIDSVTGVHTPLSGVFRSDATGAIMGSPVDPYTGNPIVAPDPMAFARKLDFTYKPR